MQIGSEFLHICHEQVELLTCGLGASLAVVALVERPIQTTEAQKNVVFLPVATYPEAFATVDPQTLRLWLEDLWIAETEQSSTVPYDDETSYNIVKRSSESPQDPKSLLQEPSKFTTPGSFSQSEEAAVLISGGPLGPRTLATQTQNQIVMPLIYQEVMVGLLVTARVDRGWNTLERYDVERIGQTLAAACVLEQRSQWLEQRLRQQTTAYTQIHEHQQEVLDDVLHQFRNPLTALRTFGKLLIKRLKPTDRNRTVAESIVRESDRLQELLKQLSEAAALPSTALPGASLESPQHPSPHAALMGRKDIPSEVIWAKPDDDSDNGSSDNGNKDNHTGPARNDSQTKAIDQPPTETGARSHTTADPNTLDTVKALTGHSLQIQECDPMAVLEPLLLSAHAIAQDRNLELCVTGPEHRVPILADHKALREVCNNLIDNALKYTPADGRVDLVVGIEKDGLHQPEAVVESEKTDKAMQGIAIADTGPGIPIADQPHLFERHFRGIQSQGDIPGTGLGLAIAQLLTQQMGGFIEVFSPIHTCDLDHLTQLLSQSRTEERYSLHSSNEAATPDTESHHPLDSPLLDRGTLFIIWLPQTVQG